jgi:hypothetical protein
VRGRAAVIMAAVTIAWAEPGIAAESSAKVTFLNGSAKAGGRKLSVGSEVAFGETITTAKSSRVELTFPDGSRVRLAADVKLELQRGAFEGQKRESVSLKLLAGRIWASVVKATGGSDAFEVETKNAVSGVRGTSFAVLAASDTSALVRVYTGTVGVRPIPKGERKQVPGPTEVDRKQWEEIIATAMKQVRVSAAGDIAPAEDFEDEGESAKWAKWNRERDAASGAR